MLQEHGKLRMIDLPPEGGGLHSPLSVRLGVVVGELRLDGTLLQFLEHLQFLRHSLRIQVDVLNFEHLCHDRSGNAHVQWTPGIQQEFYVMAAHDGEAYDFIHLIQESLQFLLESLHRVVVYDWVTRMVLPDLLTLLVDIYCLMDYTILICYYCPGLMTCFIILEAVVVLSSISCRNHVYDSIITIIFVNC